MDEKLLLSLQVVHGARYWPSARFCAAESGITICSKPPPVCIAVLIETGSAREYVGSVGAVEHDHLLMFEWFVLNRHLSARVRHAGAVRMMLAGMDYAAAVGKRTTIVVDRRRGGTGIKAICKRLGFALHNEALEVLEG